MANSPARSGWVIFAVEPSTVLEPVVIGRRDMLESMALANSRQPIDFQDRDILILRGLFESRVMTLAHVTTLYFDGRAEAAKKRVQKLKSAGVIAERPRRPYEPSVLFLTRKAFRLLSDRGELVNFPHVGVSALEKRAQVSDSTIRHELAVMDAKAAIHAAAAPTPNFKIAEFSTWPALTQFHGHPTPIGPEVLLKPDGYLRVHECDASGESFEHTFFLEIDRSTETQDVLVEKAACYVDFYRRGGLAIRNGRPAEAYKDFPFRVLMVFATAERRNNLAERLLTHHPPILTQVWLTTFTELIKEPLGAIWVRPADFREALGGGPPKPAKGNSSAYRRQPERDRRVDERVTKCRLLDP